MGGVGVGYWIGDHLHLRQSAADRAPRCCGLSLRQDGGDSQWRSQVKDRDLRGSVVVSESGELVDLPKLP
jgi:hypothetical protein